MPIDTTAIKTLYVFVEISIDSQHLAETIRFNFPDDRGVFEEQLLSSEEYRSLIAPGTRIGTGKYLRIEGPGSSSTSETKSEEQENKRVATRLALVSTIQFAAALQRLNDDLSTDITEADNPSQRSSASNVFWTHNYETIIPRSKPLSPGEILGCTAPTLKDVDALLYELIRSMISYNV